jgi:hypothetical protein
MLASPSLIESLEVLSNVLFRFHRFHARPGSPHTYTEEHGLLRVSLLDMDNYSTNTLYPRMPARHSR